MSVGVSVGVGVGVSVDVRVSVAVDVSVFGVRVGLGVLVGTSVSVSVAVPGGVEVAGEAGRGVRMSAPSTKTVNPMAKTIAATTEAAPMSSNRRSRMFSSKVALRSSSMPVRCLSS